MDRVQCIDPPTPRPGSLWFSLETYVFQASDVWSIPQPVLFKTLGRLSVQGHLSVIETTR